MKTLYNLAKLVFFVIITFFYSYYVSGQTHIFATLQGSPMDTSGWNVVGAAYVGNTSAEAPGSNDELIVCPATCGLTGGCFYKTPVNLSMCTQWTAEFDYRIWEGTSPPADGMAFCFLANPPTGYESGQGCGIPALPDGIMIVLDVWNNCGDDAMPKLEIRYGPGTSDYTECPSDGEPTLESVTILNQPTYNHMKITYKNGNINVYINNVFYLSGYYLADYTGYFGFTAGTGSHNANQSVKNVIIYTTFPKAVAGASRTICSGDTTVIGTDSTMNYTYSWTPPTGLDNPNKSNPALTLTNTTLSDLNFEYKVTVDSGGTGCNSIDSILVTVKAKQQINLGKDTAICLGNSLTLNAGNPGSDYIWNTGATTQSITVSSTGKYLVTVTNGNCSGTGSINVSVNPLPPVNLGKDTAICSGNTLILNAENPGSNYIWNTGAITQSITVSSTGKYLVTATTGNCGTTGSINVSITALPIVNLGKDIAICSGTSLTLNAGNPGSNYIWNTGAATQTIIVSNMGEYLVTVTTGNCSGTGSINVSINALPIVNLKDTTICPGTDLIINPHNDTVSYTWNDNSHNTTLQVNKAGKYSVTVTDKYGCTNSGIINVSQYPVPYLNLGKDTTCEICNIVLNAGNFKEYKWQDGSNNSTYTVTTSGTYSVTVTDQWGCIYSDAIIVTEECNLFVPNAFTPNGDINNIFKAVAPPCVTNFDMKIFNRWGALLYETNDINKGWDGKFENHNVPEAVYVYAITYCNIGNSTYKLHKNGNVTLLR